MNKTIGIFAHVDAGKTTFSEQILYHTKSIRSRGRVDHKDAFLDSHKIEKERGITVFSDIGKFKYEDSTYYLLDTPGHIDFSPEMERAISILDYAIVLISAVEGVQGHTETIWELLRKHNIPSFIFINKIDREGADIDKVIGEIESSLTKNLCKMFSGDFENLNEEAVDIIAESDDELLEKYLESGYNKELWAVKLKALISENKIFPCFKGSALLDDGIVSFLDNFHNLSQTKYDISGEFKGRVFKIKYDENGNRITLIKCTQGKLKVKDEITYNNGTLEINEKINGLRIYSGNRFEGCNEICAGDIFGTLGLTSLECGQGINCEDKIQYDMVATMKARVNYDKKLNPKDVLKCFKILESEDKSLNVLWEEELKQLSISIMGPIQLEVLKDILKDRFSIDIEFGEPEILYKETISGEADGFGHFEPLGHYAEVHIKLENLPRGFGVQFENKCHSDFLTTGNQNLIKTHIYERAHKGILTGSEITDIKITLVTGRAHNKHTSGGDFREATKRALRQGLESCENILLEPYYKFTIDVDINFMGRIISDIQKMKGEFFEPENNGERIKIKGRGPVSTFMKYPMELQSFTKGKGSLNLVFNGYDICHNQEEVIEKSGYNKNADIEYTSTSIFCSKGQSYLVVASEAKDNMHCMK